MRKKLRNRIRVIKLIVFAIVLIYVLMNLSIFILNMHYKNFDYRYIPEPDSDTRALIIASHHDDEILIAGGYMIKTMQNLSDKVTVNKSSWREEETVKALGLIGIKEDNILFLTNKDQTGLLDIDNMERNIEDIVSLIKEINPSIIFLAAYEGGHCDHDMTNFAVASAIKKYNITIPVYESPEYTRYRSFYEEMLFRLEKFSIIKIRPYPRFLYNTEEEIVTINMSKEDLELKKKMLDQYESQSIDLLRITHNAPEIFRPLHEYNYSQPPYEHKDTLIYKICKIRGKSNCEFFNVCRIPFENIKTVIEGVNSQ